MPSKNLPVPGFFKSLLASIYSPTFYAGIPQRSFWKAFWYLVGVTLIVTVLGGLFSFYLPYQNHKEKIHETVQNVLHFYPEDLVVTIQDGKASTQAAQPYFISLHAILPLETWGGDLEEEDWEEMKAVVVDTKTPFSTEQFRDYRALTWLTEDAFYVLSEDERVQSFPLAEAPNMVINKDLVDGLMDQVYAKGKALLPVLAWIFFVFAFVGILFFRMIYLLFFSVLLLLVTKLLGLHYDFGAAYKTGIYAITLSSFFTLLLEIQPWFYGHGFFLMPTILSLLVATVNLQKMKTHS